MKRGRNSSVPLILLCRKLEEGVINLRCESRSKPGCQVVEVDISRECLTYQVAERHRTFNLQERILLTLRSQ